MNWDAAGAIADRPGVILVARWLANTALQIRQYANFVKVATELRSILPGSRWAL
jgi:hypothetical protein